MPDVIAAPPGWYFVRIREGESHLIRYPIAAWRVEPGLPSEPLLAKPGEPGLVPPTAEDRAALVGLVPPDREYQSYFTSEDVQDAARRLFAFLHPREAEDIASTTVREVRMPGVGDIPVRDARPPSQQGSSADWMQRAWGGRAGQPRLGEGASPGRSPAGS
jgi:hypothetical protein